MAKYIVVAGGKEKFDSWGDPITYRFVGLDYVELEPEEADSLRWDFDNNGYILVKVLETPLSLLETFRGLQAERKKLEEKRMEEALERGIKAKAKAAKLQLKKEEQQLEAARKLLREKGELN